MPHEDGTEEIIKAAEAVEKNSESEPPAKSWLGKLRSAASFITACAAFVAATAAVFKPQDHTVTKNSYETLSQSIEKLAEEEQKNHEDLANLRGYLDGLAHAPLAAVPTGSVSPVLPTAPSASVAPLIPLIRVHPASTASTSNMNFTVVDQAGPVPTVHAAVNIKKPPRFADVAAEK